MQTGVELEYQTILGFVWYYSTPARLCSCLHRAESDEAPLRKRARTKASRTKAARDRDYAAGRAKNVRDMASWIQNNSTQAWADRQFTEVLRHAPRALAPKSVLPFRHTGSAPVRLTHQTCGDTASPMFRISKALRGDL